VNKAANPPAGAQNVSDSVWPNQFTAHAEAWCYGDFTAKTATAKGKFYYDGTNGRSRADWAPYINGKDATQIWIGESGAQSSNYYVKTGKVCIYFPITDPGTTDHFSIGIESANWVQKCDTAGFAKYVGREQVSIDNKEVWTDHWSCHLAYAGANQSITFQNWHSLGLDSIPKGLPLRVTGGNSAPDGKKGSPRLNTVWYSNFTVGPDAFKPSDFAKPKFCIPVPLEEAQTFFTDFPELQTSHTFNHDFHKRAHFLPLATASKTDLARAAQVVPSKDFKGKTFSEAKIQLNHKLQADKDLSTKSCESFDVAELFTIQELLFAARTPAMQNIYDEVGDTRSIQHKDVQELRNEQAGFQQLLVNNDNLIPIIRDGLCHEIVMWYVHHLTDASKAEVKHMTSIPLLPPRSYEVYDGQAKSEPVKAALDMYQGKISCAVCHVG
jgi:hypothetical protein